MSDSKESDRLKYKGNDFPLWLILVWVAFAVFFVTYFVKYGVPDLLNWIK